MYSINRTIPRYNSCTYLFFTSACSGLATRVVSVDIYYTRFDIAAKLRNFVELSSELVYGTEEDM